MVCRCATARDGNVQAATRLAVIEALKALRSDEAWMMPNALALYILLLNARMNQNISATVDGICACIPRGMIKKREPERDAAFLTIHHSILLHRLFSLFSLNFILRNLTLPYTLHTCSTCVIMVLTRGQIQTDP